MKRAKCIALVLLMVFPLSLTFTGCSGSSSDSSNIPAAESDWDEILNNLKSLDPAGRKEILIRLFFYQAGLKNCYIARTKTGENAAMQWLIYPSENSIVQQHFNTRFYPLKKNQVMIR